MEQIEPFAEGFVLALAPEFVLVIGLFTLMIVPNMGNAKFRIPLTQIRVPWFFGGKRGKLDSDPRLPGLFATVFFTIAFGLTATSFVNGMVKTQIVTPSGTPMLQIDEFSRMFELIFFGALALASAASVNRLPATNRSDRSLNGLYNNRRQVDFYILLMTTGLGMAVVALAQDLFMLFIGLELASFSTYVLVSTDYRCSTSGRAPFSSLTCPLPLLQMEWNPSPSSPWACCSLALGSRSVPHRSTLLLRMLMQVQPHRSPVFWPLPAKRWVCSVCFVFFSRLPLQRQRMVRPYGWSPSVSCRSSR